MFVKRVRRIAAIAADCRSAGLRLRGFESLRTHKKYTQQGIFCGCGAGKLLCLRRGSNRRSVPRFSGSEPRPAVLNEYKRDSAKCEVRSWGINAPPHPKKISPAGFFLGVRSRQTALPAKGLEPAERVSYHPPFLKS